MVELYSGLDRREIDADIPPEVVEEGSRLVEELLQAWVSTTSGGEDAMDVDGQQEQSPEEQLEELKKCVERFRPQVEQNLWAQRILESLG